MANQLSDAPSGPFLRPVALIAAAGLLAGLIAFGLGELVYGRFSPELVGQSVGGNQVMRPTLETKAVSDARNSATAFGLLGGVMGLFLGVAGGLERRSIGSAAKAGCVGLVLGATVGAVLSSGPGRAVRADAGPAHGGRPVPLARPARDALGAPGCGRRVGLRDRSWPLGSDSAPDDRRAGGGHRRDDRLRRDRGYGHSPGRDWRRHLHDVADTFAGPTPRGHRCGRGHRPDQSRHRRPPVIARILVGAGRGRLAAGEGGELSWVASWGRRLNRSKPTSRIRGRRCQRG